MGAVVAATLLSSLTMVSPAGAVTNNFSNNDGITIPATGSGSFTGAPANPYPSSINVTGPAGVITDVDVTIGQFSHTFPNDVDMLLVAPNGTRAKIMSDVGGSTDVVNRTFTLDDSAAGNIPSPIVNGTFRPTNVGSPDAFPAPAPPDTTNVVLSTFNGLNPNGTWQLFLVDDALSDIGSMGGWRLTITRNLTPVANNDTYNGQFYGPVLTFNATNGVLANDTDDDPLTAQLNSQASRGTVTLNPNGSFTYQPIFTNIPFPNSDSFTYRACDGVGPCSPPATVTINFINGA